MTPRLNLWILAILLILGIPWYWLLADNSLGNERPKDLSIAQLRALATRGGAALPQAIRYEEVGSYSRMGNLVAAGSGVRARELEVNAFIVEYSDRAPVLIGSGVTSSTAQKRGYDRYDQQAQDRVVASLAQADLLVPLDADPAQTGGLQMLDQGPQRTRLLAGIARLNAQDKARKPYAAAPGVVVIPAESWRIGARLVFVRLRSGNEYLFTGQLAPSYENVRRLRAPARLFTQWYRDDDRGEIHSWLLTVRRLSRQAPGLETLPGSKLETKSGIGRYFTGAR